MDTVISNSDVSLSSSASSAEDYDSISLSESSNSDAVVIENAAAINEKIDIDELKELHDLLIKMLKNLKMDEFVKFLKAKKRTVDRSYRKQNAAVSTFSGVSAVGGVIMIAGGCSAIATLGASLSLVLAGGVIVGVGTFGTVTAQIAGKIRRRLIIRRCKKELKNKESHTNEIGKVFEQFCNKCKVVCETLEELELSIENLKELDPVIFKFALIGWLSTPKVAAAVGTSAAGAHVTTAAHASHFVHLRFLGKAIIPAFKVTEAVLGVGMAISGIGIVLDVIVGGKALYDVVKGTECSESKSISEAISKAEKHAETINKYLQLLEHNAAELLTKVIESTKSTKQQLKDKTDTIKQLRETEDQNRAEIERLRMGDDEKTAKIERLKMELLNAQQRTK